MQVGRYELLLPAARGGMAEVWSARLHGTRGFQKLVALKMLREDIGERARCESMFLAEARLASKIRHPNVVETFELGEADGSLFLIMEWVDGVSLRQLQQENNGAPIPLTVAVHLIAQCCKGLHAAHEVEDENGRALGLVHRDISPHNIMVTYSGIAKVTDFGIAKVNVHDDQELTVAGEVKGKVPYMAPEYIEGKTVDRRADLFALGLVLYELTTGHHPFRGATAIETVRNLIAAEAVPPRRYVPNFPTALSAVIRKAIRLDPAARFVTAMDFLAMLQQALPEAFTQAAEQQTVGTLDRLLNAKARARHEALQRALAKPSQKTMFSQNSEILASPTGQSGTMGAVTSDHSPEETRPRLTVSHRPVAARHAFLGAAVALGCVSLLGGMLNQSAFLGFALDKSADGERATATPSPVPAQAPARPEQAAVTRPVAPVASAIPAPSLVPAPSPNSELLAPGGAPTPAPSDSAPASKLRALRKKVKVSDPGSGAPKTGGAEGSVFDRRE
jgi:serine/threonine-protein kinase